MKNLVIVLFLFSLNRAVATPKTYTGDGSPVLMELFTSEGCSSCPPADRYVSKIGKNPGIYTHFVPIVFHVDYWDYLGWKDRFSHESFSHRQRNYARQKLLSSVATPTIVVDGTAFRGWRKGLLPAKREKTKVKLMVSPKGKNRYQITLVKAGKPTAYRGKICLIGRNIPSKIKAGENAGLSLVHDSVALGCADKQMKHSKGRYTADMIIPLFTKERIPNQSFAAWIETMDSQRPLWVIGGSLGG